MFRTQMVTGNAYKSDNRLFFERNIKESSANLRPRFQVCRVNQQVVFFLKKRSLVQRICSYNSLLKRRDTKIRVQPCVQERMKHKSFSPAIAS